eukprot:332555-Pyramimonas_sp.AAC.1
MSPSIKSESGSGGGQEGVRRGSGGGQEGVTWTYLSKHDDSSDVTVDKVLELVGRLQGPESNLRNSQQYYTTRLPAPMVQTLLAWTNIEPM